MQSISLMRFVRHASRPLNGDVFVPCHSSTGSGHFDHRTCSLGTVLGEYRETHFYSGKRLNEKAYRDVLPIILSNADCHSGKFIRRRIHGSFLSSGGGPLFYSGSTGAARSAAESRVRTCCSYCWMRRSVASSRQERSRVFVSAASTRATYRSCE